MEMADMGEVRNTDVEAPMEGSSKKEKHYPTLSISSKQIPALKNKKFGDNIELHIKGEVAGVREDYSDKEEAECEIKIKECGIMKGNVTSKDEYDNMSDDEKDDADEKEVMGKE